LDRLVSTHSLQYGTFDYDEMGWLPANDTVSYEYDAKGRLVLEQHPLKYYTFEYTDAGQLLSRATWNINSITHYAANDLVETYSQFNAFGQPTVVTATSPTGKEWNEYIGRLVYDEDGNLIEEKHYSNETPAVLKYAEYWTYEDGILREHRLPTVYDDGLELENEREVFTPVDGNPDVIEHEIFLYNGDGTWSKMAGTRCIDEYGYLPVGSAPEIELVDEYDGGINIVGIQLLAGAGSDVRLYCSGILMNEGVDLSVSEMLAGQVFSMSGIKNGTYEFMAVIDGKASNIITYTFDTPLRAVTDVHAVSMRSDFEGNTYVTIGWTNPEYELMPFVSLPFRSHNVFFENMRTAEASTTDSAATQLEVNFGADKVKTLFVQTRYGIGHINSEPITINLDNLSTSLDEIVSESSSSPIYDLQGRHQARPTKGVYIQRGKKVLR